LGIIELNARSAAEWRQELKRTPLQALVENAKPIHIPKQNLYAIAITVQEQEQVASQRVFVKDLPGSTH
jgi:hypothetical protein